MQPCQEPGLHHNTIPAVHWLLQLDSQLCGGKGGMHVPHAQQLQVRTQQQRPSLIAMLVTRGACLHAVITCAFAAGPLPLWGMRP